MNTKRCNSSPKHRESRGPSSAWLHDPEMVLSNLQLKDGQIFVDLGCGAGDYTLAAAAMVGSTGQVYALDKLKYLTDGLALKAKNAGRDNVVPLTSDILSPLPLEDQSVDVVFIATVLHIFNLQKISPSFFQEIHRVLKPGGIMAIVECKKEDRNFGPPKEMCHAPEEIQTAVQRSFFVRKDYTAFEHTYLLQFAAAPIRGGGAS